MRRGVTLFTHHRGSSTPPTVHPSSQPTVSLRLTASFVWWSVSSFVPVLRALSRLTPSSLAWLLPSVVFPRFAPPSSLRSEPPAARRVNEERPERQGRWQREDVITLEMRWIKIGMLNPRFLRSWLVVFFLIPFVSALYPFSSIPCGSGSYGESGA